jgi:transcriptional regulator with GAF, ATPase, and Fis domain
VRLLRVLQDGEFARVGSGEVLRSDARVIAASNVDLARAVEQGTFRRDLYYRLSVFPVHVPPLRERREDIHTLVIHFLEHYKQKTGRFVAGISREAVRALVSYDWPGNIRELENAIIRAVALCERLVRPEDLPERVREAVIAQEHAAALRAPEAHSHEEPARDVAPVADEPLISLSELEGRHIARVLAHTGGNKQAAARLLGIDRTTLQRMIKRHGLDTNGARANGDDPSHA